MTPKDVLNERKRLFESLLHLCKGGARRTVTLKDDHLIKAKSDREFCAVCAKNIHENDFLIKLFSLRDRLAQEAPEAPASGEDAAKTYLEQCASMLRKWANEVDLADAAKIAEGSVAEFATQFSGKLIHPSAEDCAIVGDRYETSLAHISSRSMRKAGHEMFLDQSKNDNSGRYQRVCRIVADDPIAKESGLSDEVINAMKAGAMKGLENANSRVIKKVDHRLRQLLIPSGDGYISISPVAAGGLNAVIGKRVSEWESSQTPQEGKEKTVKRLKRIDFRIGGAKQHNVTMHYGDPDFAFAHPLYFSAPQRSVDVRDVWSFVHRKWRPRMSRSDVKAVGDQLAKLQKDSRFADSSSISAISAQARGSLEKLARNCDKQAKGIAEKMAMTLFQDLGQEVPIDKSLIEAKRGEALGPLDQCIVDQNFGAEYRESLARAITSVLHAKLHAIDRNELNAEVDRARISGAIEKILSERTV